jgi:predicted acyl esterase
MCSRIRHVLPILILSLLLASTVCAEFVMVPMSDGTKLATDYFLPPGDGPFPVVLLRSVYTRPSELAREFNAAGMAYVVQHARGRGDSEGKDMVFADDGWGQNQDGVDTVNWVKKQTWCNGKIGTWGASALSIVQTLMAPATEEVSCQAIWVSASNFYGQLSYQGGVFRKSLVERWTKGQRSTHVIDIWKSHPTYDAFWTYYNADVQAAKVTAPAVHVGGWWDIFAQGTINGFVYRQKHGGEGARGNQKLIIGAWLHGPVKEPGDLALPDNYLFDFVGYTNRFMAHWLKGEDNGIMDEPAVHYYTIGDVEDPGAPGNEWRTADTWPPFPTVDTAYYLTEDRILKNEAPTSENGKATFTYDPEDPCPTHGGQNLLIPAGPFDQRKVSGRSDVITFATAPLEKPVEITGAVRAELYVSSDAPDTDFTAKLIDIYPDGREILMLDNIRRVRFRNGYEKADTLPPGKIGKLEIDLWNISLVFNKGHRIGLHVSSSNYPRFEKNPNTGEDFPNEENLRVAHNTVHMDKNYPSALILPVRHAADQP